MIENVFLLSGLNLHSFSLTLLLLLLELLVKQLSYYPPLSLER